MTDTANAAELTTIAHGSARRRAWWPAAVVPLLALVALSPGVRNDFVNWDDVPYIVRNVHMVAPDGLARIWLTLESPQYYPLTFTSYWAEYQLWGAWPTGYFLTNLLLHAANSLLVFFVARSLGAGRWAAWLVGALFAIHPIQVSSVAWLAQRKNTLCGLFFMLTILMYLRYCRRGEVAAYVASLLTFACALLSKTVAVTLPASLLLVELLVYRRGFRRPLARITPMLTMAAVLGVVTIIAERAAAPDVIDAPSRPLVAAAAIWVYIAKAFWPATLVPLYPQWSASAGELAWWLPLVGLLAAGAAVWHWRRQLGVLPVWGISHFLVSMLPAIGLLPFAFLLKSPIGDHFVYFALPGLLLALACLAERLVGRWPRSTMRGGVAGAIAGILLLALGMKTWQQVQVWHDGERLWSYTIDHNPRCAVAYNNLGISLAESGREEEALDRYREASRISPTFWMARTNVAVALHKLGRLDEAVVELRGIVAEAPGDAAAHFNLADALVCQGRYAEALTEFAAALRLDPDFTEAHAALGAALVTLGRPREALIHLAKAAELAPNDSLAHFNLATALAGQGRFEQATACYLESLRLFPENPRACTNLGLALVAQGQPREAARYFRTAIELDPQDLLAHLNLGSLTAQAGQVREAEEHFRAALNIDPSSAEANNNMGALLVPRGRHEEAIRYLSEAVRLVPDHANAHYMLGLALLARQQPSEALGHFARAVELQPADAEAQARLAETQAMLSANCQPTTTPATQPASPR